MENRAKQTIKIIYRFHGENNCTCEIVSLICDQLTLCIEIKVEENDERNAGSFCMALILT